jgi:hypothetical protein
LIQNLTFSLARLLREFHLVDMHHAPPHPASVILNEFSRMLSLKKAVPIALHNADDSLKSEE